LRREIFFIGILTLCLILVQEYGDHSPLTSPAEVTALGGRQKCERCSPELEKGKEADGLHVHGGRGPGHCWKAVGERGVGGEGIQRVMFTSKLVEGRKR
jgi:hypothetical protein